MPPTRNEVERYYRIKYTTFTGTFYTPYNRDYDLLHAWVKDLQNRYAFPFYIIEVENAVLPSPESRGGSRPGAALGAPAGS